MDLKMIEVEAREGKAQVQQITRLRIQYPDLYKPISVNHTMDTPAQTIQEMEEFLQAWFGRGTGGVFTLNAYNSNGDLIRTSVNGAQMAYNRLLAWKKRMGPDLLGTKPGGGK